MLFFNLFHEFTLLFLSCWSSLLHHGTLRVFLWGAVCGIAMWAAERIILFMFAVSLFILLLVWKFG